MGLMDWLKGRKKEPGTEAATPGEAQREVPPSPGPAVIVSFDRGDGVGTLELEGGPQLRFGRSACRAGLEPVPSMRVLVTEIEPHPRGGWRARALQPAPGSEVAADSLLEAQDSALGHAPPPLEQVVATAMELGALTLLLAQAPEPGRAGIRKLLSPELLEPLGARLEFSPSPMLNLGGSQSVRLLVGQGPLPVTGLDRRFVSPDLPPGAGFLTLLGGVGMGLKLRHIAPNHPDALGPEGTLRVFGKLAQQLIQAGTAHAVVVHRAGQVLFDAREWLRRLGAPEDLRCRSLGAWLDLGESQGMLSSYGMDVADLPDVSAPSSGPGLPEGEAYSRAQEAVLLACHTMLHGNRLLADGEELVVPLGVAVGAFPLEVDNPGLSEAFAARYRVQPGGRGLQLVPVAPVPRLADVWARTASVSGGPMPFPAYRQLLLSQMEAKGLRKVASVSRDNLPAPQPPHEVLVLRSQNGRFVTMTCGIGRVLQPRGSVEQDSAHLEFLLNLPTHHPMIAESLSLIGRMLHARSPEEPPWAPEHRVRFGEPTGPLGMKAVALAWAGHVELGAGPPVGLLVPMLMTDEELVSVSSGMVPQWIEQHANSAEVLGRWLQKVPSA
ncbi:hypothetical protein [Archangium lansingense]|uniref:Uncharacterized protein n=1 Tax=Archangium lansingense TaxID=2995310 RepID=A0ABT3ZUX5_9BACT|nr:hypothetical protein [Archangium lansinium]MCY1073141.1 hypothetical protein [Archangium lansinium]